SRMSGRRVQARSSREIPLDDMIQNGVRSQADVAAQASLDGNRLAVLAWHYHDDDVAGPDASVEMTFRHLPFMDGEGRLTEYRIDRTHSNAFTVWQSMGSPTAPNAAQYAQLVSAGKLAGEPEARLPVKAGEAAVRFTLPRQGVCLFVLEW